MSSTLFYRYCQHKTGSFLLYAYFAMKEAMTATRILTSLEAWFMDRVKGVTRSTGTAAYRRIPDYCIKFSPVFFLKNKPVAKPATSWKSGTTYQKSSEQHLAELSSEIWWRSARNRKSRKGRHLRKRNLDSAQKVWEWTERP